MRTHLFSFKQKYVSLFSVDFNNTLRISNIIPEMVVQTKYILLQPVQTQHVASFKHMNFVSYLFRAFIL